MVRIASRLRASDVASALHPGLLPTEPVMQPIPTPADLATYADALVADVNQRWPELETSLDVQDDAIALSFVHPVPQPVARM